MISYTLERVAAAIKKHKAMCEVIYRQEVVGERNMLRGNWNEIEIRRGREIV